ncbi:SDR family NAD(P)-dependent oxidoreductase [Burkholderia orbicola]|uniref:SDR family NAD(P)-dependent oxidoreductase n=1 Tax=Burkholderia orbicola TaxID=2978683 RepID=UPI0039A44AC1
MKTHSGRIALVTGSALGLGRAICVGLAKRGAAVIGFDLLNSDETGALVTAAGGQWMGVEGDVSSPEDVASLFAAIDQQFGRLDVLVNNAGVFPYIRFEDMTFEQWRKVQNINVDAVFLMCKKAVQVMKRNNYGRIVNIVSCSVEGASRGYTAYKASKLGMVGFTRGLSADVGDFGITVNAVSPSFTETPGSNVNINNKAEKYAAIAQLQAIRRPAEPNDIVGAVLFMASDDCHFVTGQTLYANGGLNYL